MSDKPQQPKPQPVVKAKATFAEKSKAFLINLATGGTAAGIAKTINSPLEVAKLIMQTQPGRYSGLVQLLTALPREQGGIKALWAGNGTNVLRYFPTQALNFAFKGSYEEFFMPNGKKAYGNGWNFLKRSLAAGGLAGATSLVFVYPLDLARTRLSTDKKGADGKKRYQGLGHVLRVTMEEGGPKALYKGFGISVAGIIPYRAVYFGGYEFLSGLFLAADGSSSFFLKWFISQCNTILAQFITYPIDTVRRTLMKAGEKGSDGKVNRTYNGAIDCFFVLLREEGVARIYGGALANTYRATGAALCMVFYDEIQGYLKREGYIPSK